jgi:hypothetical protein
MTAAGTVVVGLWLHFQPLPVAVVSVIVCKEGKTRTAYTVTVVVDAAKAAVVVDGGVWQMPTPHAALPLSGSRGLCCCE